MPASQATVRNFFDAYGGALSYPSKWTTLGAILFAVAVDATIFVYIIDACSRTASAVVITLLTAFFGVGSSAVLWSISSRKRKYSTQMEPIRTAYKHPAIQAALAAVAAAAAGPSAAAGGQFGVFAAPADGQPAGRPAGTGTALLIEALVDKLRTEDYEGLQACATALGNLAFTATSRAAIVATGGPQRLNELLKSRDESVRKAAADALNSLAASSFASQAAVGEASIEGLVDNLGDANLAVAVSAAETLQSVAFGNFDHVLKIQDAGGIQALLKLAAKDSEMAQKAAALTLRTLAVDPPGDRSDIKAAIKTHGGIPIIVELLSKGNLSAQKAAIDILRSLAAGSRGNAASIRQDRGIPLLVDCLRRGNELVQVAAAYALCALAIVDSDSMDDVTAKDSMEAFAEVLTCSTDAVRQAAAHVINIIAAANPAIRSRIEKAGCRQPLEVLSMVPDGPVRAAATQALATLG